MIRTRSSSIQIDEIKGLGQRNRSLHGDSNWGSQLTPWPSDVPVEDKHVSARLLERLVAVHLAERGLDATPHNRVGSQRMRVEVQGSEATSRLLRFGPVEDMG